MDKPIPIARAGLIVDQTMLIGLNESDLHSVIECLVYEVTVMRQEVARLGGKITELNKTKPTKVKGGTIAPTGFGQV